MCFFLFITALLSTNDRAATATVEKGGAFILALAKEDFDTHMGSLAKELSRTAKDEYGVAVVGGDRCVYYFNPRMGTFNPRMGTGNLTDDVVFFTQGRQRRLAVPRREGHDRFQG